MSLLDRLKTAFATNPPLPPPSAAEVAVIDHLANEIVRRRMTTPALAFLEMSRPLNFLGAQAMQFLAPLMTAICDPQQYQILARFLERRDAIDLLTQQIEAQERVATRQEQTVDRTAPKPPSP